MNNMTVCLMLKEGATAWDKPNQTDVLTDAITRMNANPLPCIAKATVKGDRATFKVKNIVGGVHECGFHVAEDVGYGSAETIAKVIMLHVTRVFGFTARSISESPSREGGVDVELNRELTEDEALKLETFLGA